MLPRALGYPLSGQALVQRREECGCRGGGDASRPGGAAAMTPLSIHQHRLIAQAEAKLPPDQRGQFIEGVADRLARGGATAITK